MLKIAFCIAWFSVRNAALDGKHNVCNMETRIEGGRGRDPRRARSLQTGRALPGARLDVGHLSFHVGQGRKYPPGGGQELQLPAFLQETWPTETLPYRMEPLKSHRNVKIECGQSTDLL